MIRLSDDDMALVKKILRSNVPQEFRVMAFGSRVTGERLKPHSDLDLCVKGDRALTSHELVGLRDAFADSDLPMRVDVIDWADTAPNFQAIIEKQLEEVVF